MEMYDSFEKGRTKDIIRDQYWYPFIGINFAFAYAKIWKEISKFDKYLANESSLRPV